MLEQLLRKEYSTQLFKSTYFINFLEKVLIMNVVDRILELCSSNNVSVARCERACGFSNGYLKKMRGKDIPAGKLQATADFFGVTVDFLLTGKEPAPDPAADAQEPRYSRAVWELLSEAETAPTADVEAATAMLRRINAYRKALEKMDKG